MDRQDGTAVRDPYRTLDGHAAILYGGDESLLIDHVVLFVCENVAAGHPVLIVATQAHREAFVAALRDAGANPDEAIAAGQFICLDAIATLEEILSDGHVDWRVFERNVGERIRNLRMRGPLRVYGEMVGILWALGRHELAIELEAHWNRLLKRVDCGLLCGYEIDVFSPEFLVSEIDGIVCAHGQVLTCGGPLAP
jgi:KaiC/GvpD/RAD55 family RecA-like ATPase